MATSNTLTQAVIATGGKQYLVTVGAVLRVEKLMGEAGKDLTLDTITFAADDKNVVLAPDQLKDVKVTAEVLEHGRGRKIRVFKYKAKKRYRKTQGHRQDYTQLKIKAITA